MDAAYELSINNGVTWVKPSKENENTFKGLINDTEYEVLLRAKNEYGVSDPTNVKVTPQGETIIYNGRAGRSSYWRLRKDTGKLEVTGTGEVDPKVWEDFEEFIESVEMSDEVEVMVHTHHYIIENIPPGCESGYTIYTCMYCDYSYTQDIVPGVGHSEDAGTVILPPTETTEGQMEYKCTVCGASRIENIPVLNLTPHVTTNANSLSIASGAIYKHISAKSDIYIAATAVGIAAYDVTIENWLKISGTATYQWDVFFEDTRGNVYVGSTLTGVGVYHLNGTVATKVISSGGKWRYFYEDSKGNVYASSGEANNSLYRLNGTEATEVAQNFGPLRCFFEDSRDNVYAGTVGATNPGFYLITDGTEFYKVLPSNVQYVYENKHNEVYAVSMSTGYLGLYHLNGNTATKVTTTTSSSWDSFFESSHGEVYVYTSVGAADTGIYHLTPMSATLVVSVGSDWRNFFEDSAGNIYVSAGLSNSVANTVGIYHLNGTTATKIVATGERWNQFFEDSGGNVYVGSNNHTTNAGAYLLKGSATPVKVITTGSGYNWYFEDSRGNVYVTGTNNSPGAFFLNGENTGINILNTGYGWEYFLEDSKGNVYLTGTVNSLGVYYLNGADKAIQIVATGYNWNYLFEDSGANVYIGGGNATGVYHVNGPAATQIISSGTNWKNFYKDRNGKLFISSSGTGKGIYRLNSGTATQAYSLESEWNYWEEKDNQLKVASTGSNGQLIWNESTEKFALDPSVSSDYGGAPLGSFTWNSAGTGKNIWYKKELMLTRAGTLQQFPVPSSRNNSVGLAANAPTAPVSIWIIAKLIPA